VSYGPYSIDVTNDTTFPNVETWMRAAGERQQDPALRSHSYFTSSPDWYGLSIAKALRYGHEGWTEGADLIREQFAAAVASRTSSVIPTIAVSDEPDGGDVDVAGYLAGDDEHWTIVKPGERSIEVPGNAVTFDVSIFLSCSIAPGQAVVRALGIAAAVYLLDRAGLMTEVTVSCAIQESRLHAVNTVILRAPLKRFGEPADLARLAFWCGHPAAYRRFMVGATAAICLGSQPAIRISEIVSEGRVVCGPLISSSGLSAADIAAWTKRVLDVNGVKLY